jgi:thiamine pyrophosphate-dependent acetolactate synthase large subunit-like protein
MGRGLLSDAHPRCLNPVLGQAQADADTVLLVGARMDWVFQFGGQLHADARIIQIDIEPGEIGRNRAAEIGLVGDAAATLQSLLTAVEQSAPVPESPIDRDWLNALLSERAARLMDLRRLTSDTRLPVRPHCLVAEIRDAVPDDTVFVVDGNVIMAAAEESLPSHIPLGRMTAGHNGCMGVGLPFALAAKLHDPDRPVVLICGDYAFSLAALELETAARNQLPVVVVIANNGGAAGALYDHPAFNGVVTTYHPVAHYERIATAFGGIGESIDTPAQIAPAIRRALEANRPTCLNVTVDPHAPLVGR